MYRLKFAKKKQGIAVITHFHGHRQIKRAQMHYVIMRTLSALNFKITKLIKNINSIKTYHCIKGKL